MLRGIALAQHLLPVHLAAGLALHNRGGEGEYQFLYRDRLLPVWDDGQLRFVPWGCRRDESRLLPPCHSTWLATVEAGGWNRFPTRPVEIPATLILEGAVWTFVTQGLRGLLATDENMADHVYVICEPASYYYRVMTRGEWMPVLIGESF